MRFITRTLPWVVILVVIAFFIGLKQSSNRVVSSTAPSSEKKVASKLVDSSKDSSPVASEKSDAKSETSATESEASADQPEATVIIEESVVTEEEPSATDDKNQKETGDQPEGTVKPEESKPDPNDGDLIDLKLFESAVEKEGSNQATKSSKTDEKVDGVTDSSSEASEPAEKKSPEVEETTSLLGSPILLSMNPPVLNQPISDQGSDSQDSDSQNSGSQADADDGWEWSEAVEEVQSESSEDSSGDTSNSSPSVENQGEMPTMYGPAKEETEEAEEAADNAAADTAADDAVDTATGAAGDDAAGTSEEDACDEDAASSGEAEESSDESSTDQPAEQSPKQEAAPRKPLSPEMQKLRNSVRQTIEAYSKPILNTRDNTVAQLLDVCEAFGCDAEVMYVDQKRKINAFANLCYNYPCAGYKPLKISNGRIEPRLGYGFQVKPGQMLAVMALGRVPENYPVQFSEKIGGTVADLVQREKETCREGEDLSFKLIGISRYTPSGETWKSESGQTWSIERLLNEVLKQPAQIDNVAGTNRLMALSYAVDRRMRREEPINGPYAKAAKYIADFQDYALSMINSDGTWHPRFFLSKGTGSQDQGRLQSTGHILRWLAFSLPEERLQDPRVIKAIYQVQRSLGGNARNGLASSSPRAIDSRLTAVHALVLYNNRFFKPYDSISEEAEVVETAQNEKASVK